MPRLGGSAGPDAFNDGALDLVDAIDADVFVRLGRGGGLSVSVFAVDGDRCDATLRTEERR